MTAILDLKKWIKNTNNQHKDIRKPCSIFQDQFAGFYDYSFLKYRYFVVTAQLPFPSEDLVESIGLKGFDINAMDAITYDNTYYVRPSHRENLSLHFHELVHCVQWKILGKSRFLKRYINEVNEFGYKKAPLEDIAYSLEADYLYGKRINVKKYVKSKI
jgi:hypothetical protein